MDWQREIERFSHLNSEKTAMFAPPREMEQAIATYNKAVDLLSLDSFDIALIALKRLAASYPMFAQAALLLGCCQMQQGDYADAAEHFEHARLLDMPDDEHEKAEAFLAEAKKQQELQEQLQIQEQKSRRTDKRNHKGRTGLIGRKKHEDGLEEIIPEKKMQAAAISSIPGTGASILQSTGRKQRVRMASEKEKQDVIRRSEFPEEEETHIVYDKNIFDYVRQIVPIMVVILAAAALVWGGIALTRHLRGRNNGPGSEARLEWLETRLGDLADSNDDVLELLQDYNTYINPTEAEETTDNSGIAETTIPSEPTTTTTIEPTTEETTTETTVDERELARQSLEESFEIYSEAFELQNNDKVEAAKMLQELQTTVEDIPDDIAITVDTETDEENAAISSEQLKADIDSLFSSIAGPAADSLRLSGRSLFDQNDYEAALEDYLLAYSFDPDNYGGNVAYYCGRCYQELERYDEAKPYFEYVVENFPRSELAGYAANRISMMGF